LSTDCADFPGLKTAIDNKNLSRFLPDINLQNLWIEMYYPVLPKQDHTAQFDRFIYNSTCYALTL